MDIKKLKDISEIIMGQSPNSDTYNETGKGIPFFQGKADFGKENPNVRVYCSKPIKVAKSLDILMSVRAPVGDVNIANVECCIGRGLCAIRGKSDINSKYLYYYLIRTKEELNSKSTGSTFKAINKSILEDLNIPIIPLNRQNKITSILDKAQELIDKRKEQIKALDELVKSRFIEMFGDVSENPKGWNVELLEKYIDVIGGYAFKSTEFINEGIPVLKIGNINAGYFKPTNLMFWKKDEKLNKYLIRPKDLVISLTGTVGKDDYGNVCIMSDEYEEYYLNQRNAKLEIKSENLFNKYYLTYLLKVPEVKKRLTGINRGVRQANIANKDILNLEVLIPPIGLQDDFSKFVNQIDKLKFEMQESLKKLENNFNSLMQSAFKGEMFN